MSVRAHGIGTAPVGSPSNVKTCCTGRRSDRGRFGRAGPGLLALALTACDMEVPRRDAGWDGAVEEALEAAAALVRASQIATLARQTSTHEAGGDRGHDAGGSRTGPFWAADSLAAAAAASGEMAAAAQTSAQDAWAGRDAEDSALFAETFRLADAAWENTKDAARASATAWEALSSDVGAVDAASLSATLAAVEEILAARETFFAAAAAARALRDSVAVSPDSAALAVWDAVDSAMANHKYRLPVEAPDSALNALADLTGLVDSPRERALLSAIRWQYVLTTEAARNARIAVRQTVLESSAAYTAWEEADSVEIVAREALNEAAARLDYSKSRELTVLAAMATREALDAASGAWVSYIWDRPDGL